MVDGWMELSCLIDLEFRLSGCL